MKRFFCYMIISNNDNNISHYIGFTTNPLRRIRQHNQIIKGGAKATKKHNNWEFLFIIEGFKSINESLSCEWKLKHPNNKKCYNLKKRLKAMSELFTIDNKFTNKCEPIKKNDIFFIYLNSNYEYIYNNLIFSDNIMTLKIRLSNLLLIKHVF